MRQWVLKNNLSSGELSPLLWTRTDVKQFANGAKKLLNVIPLVEGGAKKRPGTRFRGNIDTALRMIPFVANSENTYLIILGIGKLWVYDPRTFAVVWEAVTPYDTAQKVSEVQYAHTRHRMYMVQGDTPVHRFITSEKFDNWQFSPFTFSVQPTDEIGTSPNVSLTPSGTEVGQIIALTSSLYPYWQATETYLAGDRVMHGIKYWRSVVDNKNSEPDADNANWTEISGEQTAVFTAEHIGAVVSINGGQVKITSIINPMVVHGEVLVKLNSGVQAIAKSWTLNSLAFTANTGYPRTVVFFKQRLVFANTKTSPNQMWFSSIGNDGDFLETTDDADAFSIASSSAQSDNILHLAQRKGVVALTGGSEFLISSSGAMTPSTAQIDQHTSYGVQRDVKPCHVGGEMLFVQRGGERLRAMSFSFDQDLLVSPELSAIAPHMAQQHSGIKELTFQQTPYSLVWIVLNDGNVASITLNRDQDMNAWALHDFGGKVMSVCALPTSTGSDQCFMLTKRKGKTFIEELLDSAQSDCEITLKVGGNAPTWVLSQLDNVMMNWKDEGGYFYQSDDFMVQGDEVKYIGQVFESEIDLLPPDFSEIPATLMFHKILVHEAVLWLNNSVGGFVNGYEVQHKKNDFQAFLNLPFTGYVDVDLNGWSRLCDLEMKITHNKPMPFHLQSISMLVSINEK